MCVSLRETVGDRDVDDEATWTYSRRVSRRDTHIRCAPSKKRENHASLLPDQEVFGLLALGGEGLEPARLLAAAGPGFLRIGRIAVLRRPLLSGLLAGLARLRRGARPDRTSADRFFDGLSPE